MAQPSYQFPEVWTEADLEFLPDDGHKFEILDGCLHVTPPPLNSHQCIGSRLIRTLWNAAPPDWVVLYDSGVRAPGSNFIPDVVVLRPGAGLKVNWQEPENVALVVEITSPSTATYDRTAKAAKYAEAGIASYWRIATDGTITVDELAGDHYETVAIVRPGSTWTAAQPFDVLLSPDDLIA